MRELFLLFFFPTVVIFYLIYKYPLWFVDESQVEASFYWFGKSTSFYSTVYSGLVCFMAGKVVFSGKTPYGKDKRQEVKWLSEKKFTSIFLSQLILFYLVPYFLPALTGKADFWHDSYSPVNKNAYVYVYNGFTSREAIYIFAVVPLAVWFFGKRYCSWFCACGNLAEAVGITKWGNQWVEDRTPRGKLASRLEVIQYVFLAFAICFGVVMFLDTWAIVSAPDLILSMRAVQDLVVDLAFGALIGVGAYPLLGSRIWCRYGCPLAAGMRIYGKYTESKFKVVAE